MRQESVALSGVSGGGVNDVLRALVQQIQKAREGRAAQGGGGEAKPGHRKGAGRHDGSFPSFPRPRLIVIKVGSALLVCHGRHVRRDWLVSLCADVAALRRERQAVILVSSGAIALGRRVLKLKPGALRLEESQAAAAAGQVRLAEAYADIFAGDGIVAAQILLTLGDTEERRRYLNARATLKTLLELNAVPVINENDTVATAEIRFGDNDRLGRGWPR